LHTVRKHEKAAHVIMQKCFESQAGFVQPHAAVKTSEGM
jgi:hypothetical protein